MKRNVVKFGIVLCGFFILVALFLLLYTDGNDATKMRIVCVALMLWMLHGIYRGFVHLKGERPMDEVEEVETELTKVNGIKGVLKVFFNPLTMRFRTTAGLFILVVAYFFANILVFWGLVALTFLTKGILFLQSWRFQNKYAGLMDIRCRREEKINALKLQLEGLKRNTICFSFDDTACEALPVGASKCGGHPDVPRDFEWPCDDEGRPLSLLLQINCADLMEFDKEHLFPVSGHLYFFYELSEMNWDNEKHVAKVMYSDVETENLCPANFPENLSKDYHVAEHALKFFARDFIPSIEDACCMGTICYDDFEEYNVAADQAGLLSISPQKEIVGSLSGYADVIQNTMLTDAPDDDILLMQLFSIVGEDVDELMFGDYGNIFFYITREQLANLDFSDVRFELQCY